MIDLVLQRLESEPGTVKYRIPIRLEKRDYDRVRISRPVRMRTTGEKSQNHHINGHCAQIAEETGNDFETVKMYCKFEAISEGYPFDTINGQVIPWSETRLDTEQAGILIETIHRVAAELNIPLVEE